MPAAESSRRDAPANGAGPLSRASAAARGRPSRPAATSTTRRLCAARVVAQQLERLALVDPVALHEDPLGALDHGAPLERRLELLDLASAAARSPRSGAAPPRSRPGPSRASSTRSRRRRRARRRGRRTRGRRCGSARSPGPRRTRPSPGSARARARRPGARRRSRGPGPRSRSARPPRPRTPRRARPRGPRSSSTAPSVAQRVAVLVGDQDAQVALPGDAVPVVIETAR